MNARNRRRRQNGLALATTLIFGSLLLLLFMTLGNLSVAALRLTANGRDKAISLSLAEAGIDNAVYEIYLNPDYGGTGAPQAMFEDAGGTRQQGTYSVACARVDENQIDVFSTGATINGKTREVRARVVISGIAIGDGAMISNGDVEINGSVTVQTEPIGNKNAHIRANGNINVSGGAASVDGRVAAAGTVTMSNGVSSDALFPAGQSGAARIAFPSEATVRAWKNEWTTAAQAGTIVNAADIFEDEEDKNATITGPAYISGDLNMSGGQKLTINGQGPIYITGNVTMTGNSTMVNTSHVIVGGTFRQVGTTLADGSPGGENPKYEANPATGATSPALISLSKHLTEAITLTGNATNNQFSVIYAVHGGITVHGSVAVRGSLVAGGEGADIVATGNYTHSYPDGAVTGSPFAKAPIVTSWIEL